MRVGWSVSGLVICCFLVGVVVSKTPFHDGIIQEVTVSIDDVNWELLFINRSTIYVPAKVQYESKAKETYWRILDTHSADQYCKHDQCRLKFDFMLYMGDLGTTFMGARTMYFYNNHQDPSLLRHTLASLAYQDMATGRRTGLVNLHIFRRNSEIQVDLGVYTVMQEIDQYYVDDHWRRLNGDLYSILYPSATFQYQGPSYNNYSNVQLLMNRDLSTGKVFVDFVTAINYETDILALGNYTDIDQLLGFISVTSMIGVFDSPLGNGDHGYAYGFINHTHGEIGSNYLINLIAWNTSDAFGLCNCPQVWKYESLIAKDIFNPLCDESEIENFPLLSKFLLIPEVKELYLRKYNEILMYTFNERYIEDFLDYTLYNINQTLQEVADYNFYSYQDFLCSIERAENVGDCSPDTISIQKYIRDRTQSVRSQLQKAGLTDDDSNPANRVTMNHFHVICLFFVWFTLLLQKDFAKII